MKMCANCKAKLPDDKGGIGPNRRVICCAHCMFNPLGCRCKYGEFDVAETYRDPMFPEFGDDDDYDDDEEYTDVYDDDWEDEEWDYVHGDDDLPVSVESADQPSVVDDAMIEDGEHRADADPND